MTSLLPQKILYNPIFHKTYQCNVGKTIINHPQNHQNRYKQFPVMGGLWHIGLPTHYPRISHIYIYISMFKHIKHTNPPKKDLQSIIILYIPYKQIYKSQCIPYVQQRTPRPRGPCAAAPGCCAASDFTVSASASSSTGRWSMATKITVLPSSSKACLGHATKGSGDNGEHKLCITYIYIYYLYVCIYICTYMYIYIYVYIFICIYLYLRLHTYI